MLAQQKTPTPGEPGRSRERAFFGAKPWRTHTATARLRKVEAGAKALQPLRLGSLRGASLLPPTLPAVPGDGLVDCVKAEKSNRERKASKGAEKRASSARQKKDKAASSSRNVKMKDDDQDEFVDDMFFVEDL